MPKFVLVQCGIPRVVTELPDVAPNRLGVIGRFWEREHAFSATHEYAYQVVEPPVFNWFQTALAHLLYNPRISVNGKWVQAGPYSKQQLIEHVQRGLEADDDIIQQWFGASHVIRLLEAANSFDEMLTAVDAVCGGHEVNTDTLSYVKRVLGSTW